MKRGAAFNGPELVAMQDVASKFGTLTTQQLVHLSHNEKAWKENEPGRELISYQKYAFELQAI